MAYEQIDANEAMLRVRALLEQMTEEDGDEFLEMLATALADNGEPAEDAGRRLGGRLGRDIPPISRNPRPPAAAWCRCPTCPRASVSKRSTAPPVAARTWRGTLRSTRGYAAPARHAWRSTPLARGLPSASARTVRVSVFMECRNPGDARHPLTGAPAPERCDHPLQRGLRLPRSAHEARTKAHAAVLDLVDAVDAAEAALRGAQANAPRARLASLLGEKLAEATVEQAQATLGKANAALKLLGGTSSLWTRKSRA